MSRKFYFPFKIFLVCQKPLEVNFIFNLIFEVALFEIQRQLAPRIVGHVFVFATKKMSTKKMSTKKMSTKKKPKFISQNEFKIFKLMIFY